MITHAKTTLVVASAPGYLFCTVVPAEAQSSPIAHVAD